MLNLTLFRQLLNSMQYGLFHLFRKVLVRQFFSHRFSSVSPTKTLPLVWVSLQHMILHHLAILGVEWAILALEDLSIDANGGEMLGQSGHVLELFPTLVALEIILEANLRVHVLYVFFHVRHCGSPVIAVWALSQAVAFDVQMIFGWFMAAVIFLAGHALIFAFGIAHAAENMDIRDGDVAYFVALVTIEFEHFSHALNMNVVTYCHE